VAGVGVSFVRGISPTDLKIGNLPGLRGKRGALIEGAFRPRPLSEKEMVRKRHHLGDPRPTPLGVTESIYHRVSLRTGSEARLDHIDLELWKAKC
jgi:hypothetical protein